MKQSERFTHRLTLVPGSAVITGSLSAALASSGYLLDSAGTVVTSGYRFITAAH
jgi:hypothetical protein